MARRPRSGIARLLALALIVSACSGAAAPTTTATAAATSTSTTTTSSTTTTTTATTTTTLAPSTTTTEPLLDIGAEVMIPDGDGPFPAVVLVHGGGWVTGSPTLLRGMARHLTDEGFLTVNTPYHLATTEVAGFPDAVDDVACAVRYAAAHPDSDGTVAVIGHSAGAHIGAIVALTGNQYASDCPIDGTGVPDKFVGLGGPYDVERLGIVMLPFFGAGPVAAPEAWLAGNPQLLAEMNPDLVALIMHGEYDGVVELSYASNFHDALVAAGVESWLEIVEEADHNQLTWPTVTGDLIATWLER